MVCLEGWSSLHGGVFCLEGRSTLDGWSTWGVVYLDGGLFRGWSILEGWSTWRDDLLGGWSA